MPVTVQSDEIQRMKGNFTMKNPATTRWTQFLRLLLAVCALMLGCSQAWADDLNINMFYTQFSESGVGPAVDTVFVQYTYATNSLAFSGNTTLISNTTDPNFGGADGIVINPNNNDLLIAGGGGPGIPGIIYQVTQAGAEGSPFEVSMSPGTTTYTETLVPSNSSKSGFPAGTMIATEKDFGYGRITIFSISPSLATGTSYPVTGDDIYVDGVAFGPDGTAYYGSGTETSNAGNFGTITFNGTQFVTHRLFGQPVGSDPRGGIIDTGTHRLSFDPYTGDIFTTGGNTIGQYDPIANVFHILAINGPANYFQLETPLNDGNGHVFATACCGLAGESENGEGNLIIVDYSEAPGHLIDASSGVKYTFTFLATNLGSLAISETNAPVIIQEPQNAGAITGQTATFSVDATGAGLTYQWQSEPPGGSTFSNITGATSSSYTTPPVSAGNSGTQFLCVVTNTHGTATSTAAALTVFSASTDYITSTSPGTLRNNFSGWVGMEVSVGNSPLTVVGLGRMFAGGNTGSHAMKIVNASTGTDVAGGSTSVSMAGGAPGEFLYSNLASGITLSANQSYYILSQEASGGDYWYDINTSVQTTTVASEISGAWSPDGATYNLSGGADQSYGPVDFQYAIALSKPAFTNQPQSQSVSAGATATFSVTATGGGLSYQWQSEAPGGSSFTNITGATSSSYTTPATMLAQSGTQYMCVVTNTVGSTPSNAATLTVTSAPASTNYVTSTSLGGLRNDFSGWVGMRFTVGSSPVTVSGLGRFFAPGDTGSHTVKIVTASNSQNVTGGSVTISMAGGTPGSFVYANLPSTVTLNANTTYYIMSQETSGGDQWYDINTTVATTVVASETSAVWSQDGATYNPIGSAGQAYVPVDFVYTTSLSQPGITTQPQSQTVGAGATATFSVTATGGGLSYQWESEAPGGSSFTNITGATSSSYTTPATTLAQSGTQYMCVVTNTVGSTPSNAGTLTVTSAPTGTNYVTSTSVGTLRSNFTGWVGMSFTVGSSPITVSGLGRMFAPGDTGSHAVEIVTASNSQEVAGGSVVISMSGGTAGSFVYANLPSTVTLNANTAYYILSQEVASGDQWYDMNTTITTAAVATETGSVYSSNGATYTPNGSAGETYGPVDFLYTTTLFKPAFTTQPQSQSVSAGATATFSVTATGGGLSYQWQSEPPGGSSFTNITGATSSSYTTPATMLAQSGTQYMCVVTNTVGSTPSNAATLTVTSAPTGTDYVTSTSLGNLRNNFSGWVGMSFTVGSSPVTVSGLGRFFAPGDTGSHTVKIVTASNSQNVTGGSVSISMSGGTAGSFIYANLPSTVTLNANTTYYILSQETSGGDQWYDINTTITTTVVASETSAVWSQDGATYNPIGSAGQAYVPVDFVYTTSLSQPGITTQPQSQTVGAGATATFSVTATGGGLSYQWQLEAPGGSSFTNISGATSSSYTTPATTLAQSGTQYMCVVTNTVGSTPSNAATLTVTSSPTGTNYVTSTSVGTLRNNFSGWVGASVTVGATPIQVTQLGRFFVAGNTGVHTVKIVNGSSGLDVPGGSVSISLPSGQSGAFVYATLASPVTLNSDSNYYIVSQETSGGDQWYDWSNTLVTTTNAATDGASVWSPDGSTYNFIASSSNHMYGPIDFVYTLQ
jgi:hypothetical protein